MKKTILKCLVVATFAMIAGYNMYQSNSKTEGMSELMLANVEALANEDGMMETIFGQIGILHGVKNTDLYLSVLLVEQLGQISNFFIR